MSIWGDIRRQADGSRVRKEEIVRVIPISRSATIKLNLDDLKKTSRELIESLDKMRKETEQLEEKVRHIKQCNNRMI